MTSAPPGSDTRHTVIQTDHEYKADPYPRIPSVAVADTPTALFTPSSIGLSSTQSFAHAATTTTADATAIASTEDVHEDDTQQDDTPTHHDNNLCSRYCDMYCCREHEDNECFTGLVTCWTFVVAGMSMTATLFSVPDGSSAFVAPLVSMMGAALVGTTTCCCGVRLGTCCSLALGIYLLVHTLVRFLDDAKTLMNTDTTGVELPLLWTLVALWWASIFVGIWFTRRRSHPSS